MSCGKFKIFLHHTNLIANSQSWRGEQGRRKNIYGHGCYINAGYGWMYRWWQRLNDLSFKKSEREWRVPRKVLRILFSISRFALFWKSGSLLLWGAFEDSNLFTDRVDGTLCLIVENVEYFKTATRGWILEWIYFFKLAQPLTVFIVQLQYTVKKKGGNPDRKPW